MEGDLMLNEASMHVLSLGVDYHAAGDSVIMRPGTIWLKDITIHDSYSNNADAEHTAILDGHLLYDRFTNMRYEFSATANNILGYDSRDFGDANFYGTVFADGQLKLTGQPGILNVDVNVTPREKTTLVYKVASPETLTDAAFITYVSHKDSTSTLQPEAIQAEKPHHVLVGRIGSEEQWEWFEKSHTYTLPISKILSMPKLLGAEYVLAFLGKDSKRAQLCRISSVKPQVKTREQITEMASHTSYYKPTRDKTYWLIHLEKPLDEIKGKVFNKSLLLNLQEQRGAYWIKKYEEAIKAFE